MREKSLANYYNLKVKLWKNERISTFWEKDIQNELQIDYFEDIDFAPYHESVLIKYNMTEVDADYFRDLIIKKKLLNGQK